MAGKYYLGLDNGTTGTTALILNEKWECVGRGYKELTQHYPKPGWVEHDAIEIWNSILYAVQEACKEAGIDTTQLACIGIDNQGETVVLWDKATGVPVYNAILWQDRRTAKYADSITEEYGGMVREKTGLMIDSYFSATKIKWILDNVEGVREKVESGRILAGTLDTWIIWKMTHGRTFVTDVTTASRTMLFNIHTKKWDQDILDVMGIDRKILAEIRDSSCVYGYTDPLDFFGARVPISGSAVDQQAALFGQGCFAPGDIKCTYGTGCFMLMNTGEKPIYSRNGILTTVAWGIDGKMTFALDGGVYITGAATQWLRDKLQIIDSAAQTEQMAIDAGDNGDVFFVPAFSGLAAPHWDSYARGMIIGITGGTTREHIVRACLESTAYQVKDNLDVMRRDANIPINRMRVDGGAVVNNFLMQFQADILGIPIDIPKIHDTTPLGAAYLAALGIGEFKTLNEITEMWQLEKSFEPNMSMDERETLLYKWHKAVERSKNWVEE